MLPKKGIDRCRTTILISPSGRRPTLLPLQSLLLLEEEPTSKQMQPSASLPAQSPPQAKPELPLFVALSSC